MRYYLLNCNIDLIDKITTVIMYFRFGEMAEWLKAYAWKAYVRAIVPQVRILFSPPILKTTFWSLLKLTVISGSETAVFLCNKNRRVRRSEVK